MPIDQLHLTELIGNPVIVGIVSILDLASLSILELLEYNLERKDINFALSEGVIIIDKIKPPQMVQDEDNILLYPDSYFYNFLNSKVRLTELGLYILDTIKGIPVKFELPVDHVKHYDLSSLHPLTMS